MLRYTRRATMLMFVSMALIAVPMLLVVIGTMQVHEECGSYISTATHAQRLETARENIHTALRYAQQHHLTTGRVRFASATPLADIGDWYRRLEEAEAVATYLPANASYDDERVALARVHDLLNREATTGAPQLVPSMVSTHPHEIWYAISFFSGFAGVFLLMAYMMIPYRYLPKGDQ